MSSISYSDSVVFSNDVTHALKQAWNEPLVFIFAFLE
jgi:hypothetical protein